jgi:hypothetical protein
MLTRSSLVCLALSPLLFLIGLAASMFTLGSVMGGLPGSALAFLALLLLQYSKNSNLSRASRWFLRVALVSLLLLLPAIALHFTPRFSMRYAHADRIYLDPPPHPMPTEGAAILRGLNNKDGVMIVRWKPGEAEAQQSPYGAINDQNSFAPPSHFTDENGNAMDFRLIGDDLLHFADDRGGTADVRWDGRQFVLTASHSAGQAQSARTPTRAAAFAGKLGDLLIMLAPMLAWLFVTRFVQQRQGEVGIQSRTLILSAVLQVTAMGVLAFALLAAPARPDEVSGGLEVLFVLVAFACSTAALGTLAWHALRLRFHSERADHAEVPA